MLTPNVIYLIDTGDEISWCDDPNPSGYIEPDDVVMYVKSSIDKAAPDLLEALELARNEINILLVDAGVVFPDQQETLWRIDAAIAKARGQ